MMMVAHIQAVLGAADDGNHVAAEEFRTFFRFLLLPALLLGLDLAHPDRDLGRPQLDEGNGVQDRFTDRDHCESPKRWVGEGATWSPSNIACCRGDPCGRPV